MKLSKPVWAIVAVTVVVTIILVMLYANLKPGSSKIMHMPSPEYDVRSDQFRRDASALFGQPLVDGNTVVTLLNGKEIFPAMLKAMREAQRSINFETFVYWQGDIAVEFAETLAERARAGVICNVILDWVGSQQMDPALVTLMEESGVNVEHFRPLNWYSIDRINNRTHRKILVMDGAVGFTGGVGIAEEWTGDAQDSEHIRDNHYQLTGPAVYQMQAAFQENWEKASGEILTGSRYFPELQRRGDTPAQVVTSAPGMGGESAYAMYLLAITVARESLLIGSPYFVPDELMMEALIAADERGVDVQVLVPGQETDSELTRRASRAQWGPLLEAEIQIYEYLPTLYHTKVMVVDRAFSLVGSTNFDPRSFRLNDEINLNVLDEAFAEAQIATFEKDKREAEPISLEQWENRPLSEKLLEPLASILSSQL